MLAARAVRARVGEDWLTHVVWQRQRFIADAGSDGAGRADADSNRYLNELPSDLLRLHARSDGQTKARAIREAWLSAVFEGTPAAPAPTALAIDGCAGE